MVAPPQDPLWVEVEQRYQRYRELEKRLEAAPAGSPAYVSALKEFGRLGKLAALYQEWERARANFEEARGILDSSTDEDLKTLAKEEMPALQAALDEKQAALLEMVAGEDEFSSRNVIIEIRAGVGGEEAALWARDLYDMYCRYIEQKKWTQELLSSSPSEQGGFKEIIFLVKGEGAFGRLCFEGGGHRVQRVPETETQGRIHTSIATVAAMVEAEDVDVHIDQKDLVVKAVAAGGPGGQNVNKVATQIQITHVPTGIQVRCMETRSQQQNRIRAMSLLRAKILEIESSKQEAAQRSARMDQIKSGDRSDRIRTYNFPQSRVTDHRLEGDDKNFAISTVLAGGLDPILDRLESQFRRQRTARPG